MAEDKKSDTLPGETHELDRELFVLEYGISLEELRINRQRTLGQNLPISFYDEIIAKIEGEDGIGWVLGSVIKGAE